MSFPPYPKYKDSGVEWIGEVPSGWDVVRLGSLFREAIEEGEDDLPVLSVSIHDGVSDRELSDSEMDRKVTRSEDRSKYKKVNPGDLVYNMMRAWQGGFGTVSVFGMVSPAYVVARPKDGFRTEFVELALRTPHAVEEMRRHSKGVTDFRLRLYWDEFKQIRVAIPPAKDFAAIFSFLEGETSKIDALIAEQERLIALLKEKRQAAISRAVTKGMNFTVPMKNSGVEWLGAVPAHWSVCALNYRYEVALGKMLDEKKISGDFLAPYLRNVDVQWDRVNTTDLPKMDFSGDDLLRYSLRPGDLLVCEGGEVGRAAVWDGQLDTCFYQKAIHRVRSRFEGRDSVRFLFYILVWATGLGIFAGTEGRSTISHLTAESFRRYRFAFPPIKEQLAIVAFLESEATKFDTLTAEAESSVAFLKERRATLIAAAVTGKIDVRAIAQTVRKAA